MAEDRHAKVVEQAHRDLERLKDESEVVGSSAMARAAKKARDHYAATDAPENDPAEIWGRRVARVLATAFTIFLLWWLVSYLLR
jgi:hypothetical protein